MDEASSKTPPSVRWLMKPLQRVDLYDCLVAAGPARHLAVQDLPGSAPGPALGQEKLKEMASMKGCRVLLVEDNEVNLEVSRNILEREGCQVTIAMNGMQALTAYDNAEFDVIFMDCQMPDVDGFEATVAIRERETRSRRRTPIIALTANAIEGDREHCLEVGMDDYAAKPVRRSAIQGMLARWYGDRRAATTPAVGGVSANHGPRDHELRTNSADRYQDTGRFIKSAIKEVAV
jgi:CheY-like chemotaxis protein